MSSAQGREGTDRYDVVDAHHGLYAAGGINRLDGTTQMHLKIEFTKKNK